MKLSRGRFQTVAWLIAAAGVSPALIAWLQGSGWSLGNLSIYRLFPLFGLIAFTLMWGHYIVGALRLAFGFDKSVTKQYRSVTSWIVLVAIILHPSLLVLKLWQDGFGLPPDSYLQNYVAPNLKWAAAFGSFSLLIFLSYELYRWFEMKQWWKFVQIASDIGMVLILVHGFMLGGDLQSGWFRVAWLFYAETYVAALLFIYYRRFRDRKNVVL